MKATAQTFVGNSFLNQIQEVLFHGKLNMQETDKIKQGTGTDLLTKREQKALQIIYNHAGKRRVYESYQSSKPEIARKYLEFIATHNQVQYIRWDKDNNKFRYH
jgi:hypothetical protein